MLPGYDLTGLLTGSEGTMALVTKVVCIAPASPTIRLWSSASTRMTRRRHVSAACPRHRLARPGERAAAAAPGDRGCARQGCREVKHQRSHPQGLEARDGLLELLGRALLEAGKLDVADAFGGVDDLGPGDAFDIDVAPDQPHGPELAVSFEDFEIDAGPLGPLKPVGRFVQAEALTGLARHLDDPVAG